MSNTVIRTNVMAMNSHRNLGLVSRQQSQASSRLSSGFRINSAADDAAGLAISEGMRAQIRGLNQASRNAQDGISLIQTAEGALDTVHAMAQRVRELNVQGANDTYNADQRGHIANEIFQINQEIARLGASTTFNGRQIFATTDPDASLNGMILHVGPDTGHYIEIDLNFDRLRNPYVVSEGGNLDFLQSLASMLNHSGLALQGAEGTNSILGTTFDYSGNGPVGPQGQTTQWDWIHFMISNVDHVIHNVNTVRASLGAIQNRLEFTIQNLDIASENLSASESRIRDADMAKEMMRLTQANVLQQAATAMLAQANQAPQNILQLLG